LRQGELIVSGERVERRLAAILAADVAGYSRLMGQGEAGTLARLRSHRRELIDPNIGEHKGRIVKTTGDGLWNFRVWWRPLPVRSPSSAEWQSAIAEPRRIRG
jgi:class 3 adenylate cyclase